MTTHSTLVQRGKRVSLAFAKSYALPANLTPWYENFGEAWLSEKSLVVQIENEWYLRGETRAKARQRILVALDKELDRIESAVGKVSEKHVVKTQTDHFDWLVQSNA